MKFNGQRYNYSSKELESFVVGMCVCFCCCDCYEQGQLCVRIEANWNKSPDKKRTIKICLQKFRFEIESVCEFGYSLLCISERIDLSFMCSHKENSLLTASSCCCWLSGRHTIQQKWFLQSKKTMFWNEQRKKTNHSIDLHPTDDDDASGWSVEMYV